MYKNLLFSLALVTVAVTAHAQTIYSGNKQTGFGGPIGNSSLSVTNDSAGNVTFTLTAGGAGFGTNDVAFYFSTFSGGLSSTSTLTDNADRGRITLSGTGATGSTSPGPSVVNFAPGFGALYGIALDGSGNGNLFQLTTPSLTFVAGANYSISSNVYTFSLNVASLGLTNANGTSFGFVANELNANDSMNGGVYRSDETIGATGATANPGSTGSLTYTGYDTYTITPEPSTYALALVGIAAVAGVSLKRRRAV